MTKREVIFERFLGHLAETGNVSEACKQTPVSRDAVYDRRHAMPEFAAKWDDALDVAGDLLEMEARRRALDGVEEIVASAGRVVGTVTKYDNRLLEFLLGAAKPDKYKKRVEYSSPTLEKVIGQLKARGVDPNDVFKELLATLDQEAPPSPASANDHNGK